MNKKWLWGESRIYEMRETSIFVCRWHRRRYRHRDEKIRKQEIRERLRRGQKANGSLGLMGTGETLPKLTSTVSPEFRTLMKSFRGSYKNKTNK